MGYKWWNNLEKPCICDVMHDVVTSWLVGIRKTFWAPPLFIHSIRSDLRSFLMRFCNRVDRSMVTSSLSLLALIQASSPWHSTQHMVQFLAPISWQVDINHRVTQFTDNSIYECTQTAKQQVSPTYNYHGNTWNKLSLHHRKQHLCNKDINIVKIVWSQNINTFTPGSSL